MIAAGGNGHPTLWEQTVRGNSQQGIRLRAGIHRALLEQAPQGVALADTTTTTVTTAIPADVYSTLILEGLYAERRLAGIVGAVNEDMTAEAGSTVQVGYMSARTAQGPISAGTALTDTASSVGTYTVTLDKYGDYDRVQREVFEDQHLFPVEMFLRHQARGLAEKVDQEVYDQLETATPGSSEDLATAGTLTDLYDKIADLKAELLKAKVRPDYVILGPDQEAQLLKDTNQGVKYDNIVVREGQVLRVAGLNTIVTPLANANVVTANETQAIVIDSSRAVGEAWGRRPDVTVDYTTDAVSDRVRLITWLRYGCDELDTTAIGHVLNP